MAIAPSLSFGAKRASAQSFLQSHRGVVRTASTAAPRTDFADHITALGHIFPAVQPTVLRSRIHSFPIALGRRGVLHAIPPCHPQYDHIQRFSAATTAKSRSAPSTGDDPNSFHAAAMQLLFDRINPPEADLAAVSFRYNPLLLSQCLSALFDVLQPVDSVPAPRTPRTCPPRTLTVLSALASTYTLISQSGHRTLSHLEEDERALESEFIVGFANAYLGEPQFFRHGRAPSLAMSNAWIHADPSPFGSTDFGLVVGSLNDSARTAACFDLKPASTSLANEIYDLVRVAPCTISWINRTPSYSSLQTIGSLTEDVAREVELHLHQIVRELHANASDTLWYGNLGNALLFKLVAPNVVEVSDRVPRTGRPVQLHQPFPGVGDTMTMSLPTGLIAAACGSKPPLSLFAPGLRQAWDKLHSVPGIQRRAEPIALPRLPATIRGPHVSKTLDCLVGRRSALELAVEGMDLGPAVLPRAPVVNGAMLPDDEPPLKVTLTRWLHSGRTYDGYAASLTGGTNRAAASARVVAKVAQPAFDMALHRDYEPTGEAPPQPLAPEAAHQAASRVYEEARLLDGELAGLVVTPRFRGLWVGNALGDLSPTAASFATYLVMLVDDAGPSLADLGYTWPSLPSHLRTGIRKLYCTLHAVRVVHGDVDLRHICMTPAGTLSLIDFEGARRVDTADAQEIRDEDTLVESNLSL